MSVTKIVKINDKLGWAYYKIESSWEQLLALSAFTAADLQALPTITHPRKKAEYLACRIALYDLLAAYDIPHTYLSKDIYGKPYLTDTDLHISLANSYPYGVAVLNLDRATGIDIELPSDKLLRVQHKFLHAHELHLQDDIEQLCLAWCTKECLYKLHGQRKLSFKDQIRIIELDYPSSPFISAEIFFDDYWLPYQLWIERVENFFIVLSV